MAPPIEKPASEHGSIIIQFLDNNLENFTGSTPNNGFRGKFTNLGEQKLQLEEFLITSTPDTEWGNQFMNRIEKVYFYSLNRRYLELYLTSEKIVLTKN